MSALKEIKSCEVCQSSALVPVLDLGYQPMCDDLKPVGSDVQNECYPILILYCTTCYTAHQQFQIDKEELFPTTYHYRSRLTADVLKGMADLVVNVKDIVGDLSGKMVMDVGCNDGSLLELFANHGCQTVGVEPTDACLDAIGKVDKLYHKFFTPDVASLIVAENGHPDVITFTNVFAHIEDLTQLIDALQILMSPRTTVVIENHYLGSVLHRNQFDTFYHEHPRTYSLHSFKYIAESLGTTLVNVDFPSRYGGNIRVFLKRSEKSNCISYDKYFSNEHGFLDAFAQMRSNIAEWKSQKRIQINSLVSVHGPLKAKAFPGRAAILVNLLGLTQDDIEAVYEKHGSPKVGLYVPGTKIPIRSDLELFQDIGNCECLLNLAWHISEEISEYMFSQGFKGKIVDIL